MRPVKQRMVAARNVDRCVPWRHRDLVFDEVLPPRGNSAFEVALGNAATLDDYRKNATHSWARRYEVDDRRIDIELRGGALSLTMS